MKSKPDLDAPVAVIGFKGWGNAGEISSGTVSFLRQSLGAQPLAEMDMDPFFDFTAERPRTLVRDGRVRRMVHPRESFSYARCDDGQDTILFLGSEPNLAWSRFIEEMTDFLFRQRVSLVILLGGTYDEILHTEPPQVSFVAEEMVLRQAISGAGGVPVDYEGQVAIHTPLYVRLKERGLPAVALWGRAPVYVQNGNFGQVERMAEIVAALGGPRPDRTSLAVARLEMDVQIAEMIDQSPKLGAYVDRLRDRVRQTRPEPEPQPRSCKVIPLARPRKG